jgi:hypothetical protein
MILVSVVELFEKLTDAVGRELRAIDSHVYNVDQFLRIGKLIG